MKYIFYEKGRRIAYKGMTPVEEFVKSDDFNKLDEDVKQKLLSHFISNKNVSVDKLNELGITGNFNE